MLPHSDQEAGYGIDFVLLSEDGRIPFSLLLESIGDIPDQDPHNLDNSLLGAGFLFGGSGEDLIRTRQAQHTDEVIDPGESRGRSGTIEHVLIGGSGQDRLQGGQGVEILIGGNLIQDWSMDIRQYIGGFWDTGNDYAGGAGDDHLWATAGADRFEFALGDGRDLITDLLHYAPYLDAATGQNGGELLIEGRSLDLDQLGKVQDQLSFGAGISPGQIRLQREEGDLLFLHSNGLDGVVFDGWFDSKLNQLGKVEFSDGTVWGREDIDRLIQGEFLNNAPQLNVPPEDQVAVEMEPFSYRLPEQSFEDPDAGDVLSFSARLTDGNPLPGWLQLDPLQALFSGTPGLEDAGGYQIEITATDGGGLSAAALLKIDVEDANPPLIGDAGDDQLTGSRYADLLVGGEGNDLLRGRRGDDQLTGGKGNDRLLGGQGRDTLTAGLGDDLLRGGRGADLMKGGKGDDLYQHHAGDGRDRIRDKGGSDRLQFGQGVAAEELWLQRRADDLLISHISGNGQVAIDGWYADPGRRIEMLEAGDGRLLLEKDVQRLVDAMAAFDPPVGGEIIPGSELGEQLLPELAAAWQPAA